MVQCCLSCQRSKVARHTKSPLGEFVPVSRRFAEIHLDIVGPLPVSEGQRYCVTLIDRYTRWTEAVPIPDIRAETVTVAVLNNWIARFGVPTSIVTDQGSQFESDLFAEFGKLLGFERKRTTAYNPKCNGFIERWHRTLKAAIMCQERDDWTRVLPTVLLGLRTAYREDLQASSAELVYGENIRVPSQLIVENKSHIHQSEFIKELHHHFDRIRPSPPSRHANPTLFISPALSTCTHVFVRVDLSKRSLQPPYEGPFKVISREEKVFQVQMRGRLSNISIDRLKPCYLLDEPSESATGEIETPSADSPKPSSQLLQPATEQCLPKVRFNLGKQTTADSQPSNIVSTKKSCLKTNSAATTSPALTTTRAGRQTKTPVRFTVISFINKFTGKGVCGD